MNTYPSFCADIGVDTKINGIDLVAKTEKDFQKMNEQYSRRSPELFERHYQKQG